MELKEVYRSFSSADANLVCSMLQAEGFHAVVRHELSSLFLEGYSVATGGIRVVVPEDQYEEARSMIEESQSGE